jgi:hypothetical protein
VLIGVSRQLKILLGITILSLSFALPFASVSAPLTTVNIDDDDVQVGDVITAWGPAGQVPSGAPVKGYWDIAVGPEAWLINTTTGNPDGSYSFEITVPDTVTGFHWIWVEDTAWQRWLSSSIITVNVSSPDMIFSPTSGQVGTSMAIIGIGFEPGLYNATFGSIRVITNGVVSGSGQISDSFNVPTVDSGSYDVTVEDSGNNELSRTFKVISAPLDAINIDDDDVQVGDVITVWGPAGQVVSGASIKGYWDYILGPGTLLLNTTTGNPDGSYSFEITVPDTDTGFHWIWVNDTSRAHTWSSSAITVARADEATIEVSPTKALPGAMVSVSGSGFTQIAGTNVTLTITTSPVPSGHVFLENGTTLADGSFSTTFRVPALAFDIYTVVATDENGVNASVNFEIGMHASVESCNQVGTKKDTFHITEDIYVNGSGFAPTTTYNISVVDDVTWTDSMLIPSRVPGTALTVSSLRNGIIPPTQVWASSLEPGKYDIVIDVDDNGKYDDGVDARDDMDISTEGFFVIPELPLGTISILVTSILALSFYKRRFNVYI